MIEYHFHLEHLTTLWMVYYKSIHTTMIETDHLYRQQVAYWPIFGLVLSEQQCTKLFFFILPKTKK